MKAKRLQYLPRLLQNAPPPLLILLDLAPSWRKALSADLLWIAERSSKLAEMPSPSEDPQAWIALVRAHPIAWRKIVADALKPRPSGQNGQTHEPPASDHDPCGPPASPWLCYNCGASFTTRRGLASHATHAHKRAGAASDCMHGTNCVACLREFHTRHRLTAHLIHGSLPAPRPFDGTWRLPRRSTSKSFWRLSEHAQPRRRLIRVSIYPITSLCAD